MKFRIFIKYQVESRGGVDGLISKAGGADLLNARVALPTDAEGMRCATGAAVVTTAGAVNANWLFHAVGPKFAGCLITDKGIALSN